MLKRWFVAIFLGLVCPAAWPFDPVRLDFEDGFQLDKYRFRGEERPLLRGAARNFDFTVDPGTQYDVWLDTQNASAGRRALAMKIFSDRDDGVKDKIELNVVKHNEPEKLALEGNRARYVAFDFMLDPRYEAPRSWVIHFQAWQCCGKPPPFAIRVAPKRDVNSEIEFRFLVRDDVTERTNPRSEGREIYRMTVARGRWNNMALWLEPSMNDDGRDGRVTLWYNGVQLLDYRGDWGYRPVPTRVQGHKLTADFAVKIGIYRPRQTTVQTIYIDNVRFGPTPASVAQ
jgi:hypothetical protein